MKITQQLVAQVKQYNASESHDYSTKGFERSPEFQAINEVLWSENLGEHLSLSEIVDKAMKFLKSAKTIKYSKTERYAQEF